MFKVMTRIYKGRNSVGFRIKNVQTGEEIRMSDADILRLVKAGGLDELDCYTSKGVDKVRGLRINLSDLPREDFNSCKIREKVYKAPTTPRKPLSTEERHKKIVDAFEENPSLRYGLQTCKNIIKLYKPSKTVVKVDDISSINNSLDVVLYDELTGLYYNFNIDVFEVLRKDIEIWKANVCAIIPSEKRRTKSKERYVNGKLVHKEGYYINDDGRKVFVALNEEEAPKTSKELTLEIISSGQKQVLNDFEIDKLTGKCHVEDMRKNVVDRITEYMQVFNGMVDELRQNMEVN